MHPSSAQIFRLLVSFLVAFAVLPVPAAAGGFGVTPIRIELDRGTKSGAITVANDEDSEAQRLQIKLSEWTQGANGKDEYRDSEDLLYFPRLMTLDKGEQKMVRVGLRVPATAQEKTYRLFIEQLPAPPPPGGTPGARIAIAVRFGVPIFVKPAKEEVRGEIEKMELM
jgi:fimbrial chaperone protein